MKVSLNTSMIPYSINKRTYFHFSPWYHTSTHSVIFNLNEIKLMLALILRSCPWSKQGTMRKKILNLAPWVWTYSISAQSLEVLPRVPLAPPALYTKLIEMGGPLTNLIMQRRVLVEQQITRGSMKWWWATKIACHYLAWKLTLWAVMWMVMEAEISKEKTYWSEADFFNRQYGGELWFHL